MSVRDTLEALIAGERDSSLFVNLARGKMRPKRAALIEALTGRFDDHHAELARPLLSQIDVPSTHIDAVTRRIDELLAMLTIPGSRRHGGHPIGDDRGCDFPQRAAGGPDHPYWASVRTGQSRRDRDGHDSVPYRCASGVVAKLSARTIQSGATQGVGKPATATRT